MASPDPLARRAVLLTCGDLLCTTSATTTSSTASPASLSAPLERRPRDAQLISQLAALSGRAGLRHEAQQAIDELLGMAKRQHVPLSALAVAYAALPDRDRAFEWFERAYDQRVNLMLFFTVHPILDSLRDDRRYQHLANRISRSHPARDAS